MIQIRYNPYADGSIAIGRPGNNHRFIRIRHTRNHYDADNVRGGGFGRVWGAGRWFVLHFRRVATHLFLPGFVLSYCQGGIGGVEFEGRRLI